VPDPKGETTAPDAADLEQVNGKEPAANEKSATDAEQLADVDESVAEDAEPVAAADDAGEADQADEADEAAAAERSKFAKPIKITPRAPMPQTPEFASGEFTPHGIGGAKRPALKKTTKSGARMRIAIGVVAAVAVIGAGVGFYVYREVTRPELGATGAFAKLPNVTIPSEEDPATSLQIKNLIAGSGPAVAKGDLAVVNFVGYTWNARKEVANTYKDGRPQQWTIGQLLPGLDRGVTGQKAGGRVMLTIPPKDGFGQQGNQQLGVAPTDTLVFVIDILGSYDKSASAKGTAVSLDDAKLPEVTDGGAGKAPKVTVPKGDPPKELVDETLIQGSGPAVRKGQALVAQYEGRIWNGGRVFDSTWTRGTPAAFPIGGGQVVPGWDKALVGKKVGSRVLLVLPPSEGYGKEGQPQAGIKGTDTLVFVIDIVGAH
jgi:FKBP-type peptidyl-prolyl cis-trans isomerase